MYNDVCICKVGNVSLLFYALRYFFKLWSIAQLSKTAELSDNFGFDTFALHTFVLYQVTRPIVQEKNKTDRKKTGNIHKAEKILQLAAKCY